MAEHRPLEHEVVGEGDRTSVELERHDPWDVELGQRRRAFPLELLADRGSEVGAVGSALPAAGVELERVLEGGRELFASPRDGGFQGPELGELASASTAERTLVRREPALVIRLPIEAVELENGSFRANDQLQARGPESRGEGARGGQPEEIGEVVIGGSRALGKLGGDPSAPASSVRSMSASEACSAPRNVRTPRPWLGRTQRGSAPTSLSPR